MIYSHISSRSFMILTITSRCLIHFELFFTFCVRLGSNFILLHADIWRRPRYWGRLKAKEKGAGVASPAQWTWIWANSGRQWGTEEPGVLQPMGLQRLGHDLWLNNHKISCLSSCAEKTIFSPLNCLKTASASVASSIKGVNIVSTSQSCSKD